MSLDVGCLGVDETRCGHCHACSRAFIRYIRWINFWGFKLIKEAFSPTVAQASSSMGDRRRKPGVSVWSSHGRRAYLLALVRTARCAKLKPTSHNPSRANEMQDIRPLRPPRQRQSQQDSSRYHMRRFAKSCLGEGFTIRAHAPRHRHLGCVVPATALFSMFTRGLESLTTSPQPIRPTRSTAQELVRGLLVMP